MLPRLEIVRRLRPVGVDLHGTGCDQVDRAQPADDLEAGEHRPILPDLSLIHI